MQLLGQLELEPHLIEGSTLNSGTVNDYEAFTNCHSNLLALRQMDQDP